MEEDKFFARKQERMRGAGTHEIAAQQVAFPAASEVSSIRSPSPSLPRPSTSAVAGPSRTATSADAQGGRGFFERVDERRQERVRGAGTHVIAAQQVAFPAASEVSSSIRSPSPSLLRQKTAVGAGPSRGSTSAAHQEGRGFFERMDERRLERVRGAGTHMIAAQQVAFPSASEVSLSIRSPSPSLPRQSMSAVAGPSRTATSAAPQGGRGFSERMDERRQERVRGAGTHVIAAQQVAFPAASEVSSSIRSPSPSLLPHLTSAVSGTSRYAASAPPQDGRGFNERIDERRQERVRGAGTHVIAAQPVAFPSVPPSEASTAETREGTPSNVSESEARFMGRKTAVQGAARKSLIRIDPRRLGRMRGAGTYKILERKVDFPEASSVASSVNECAQSQRFDDTSVGFDGGRDFDGSPIDPRLLGSAAASEMVSKGRGASIPMESTPGLQRKRPAPSQGRMDRAFESFFDAGDDAEDDEEWEHSHKKHQQSREPIPTLGDIARQQRREEAEDEERRGREQLILDQLGVRSAVPTNVYDDTRADLTMQDRMGLRDVTSAAVALLPKQRPAYWFVPSGRQSAEKQEAARAEFKDLISLAIGDGMVSAQKQGVRSNDADVLYAIIKRHFQRTVAESPRTAAQAEMLDAILGRLFVTFRRLSRQAHDRAKLIQQLTEARRKMLAMRKLCFQKRNHVMRVMRTIDALYQEQVAREQRTKYDTEMLAFLNNVRDKAQAWAVVRDETRRQDASANQRRGSRAR